MPCSFDIGAEAEMPPVWDEVPVDGEEGYALKIRSIDALPPLSAYASKPKCRFAVPGLIPLSQIIVFASESGHGKSFFLLWLLSRITQGLSALGRETLKCSALVFDAENPWEIVAERAAEMGLDLDNPLLHWWGTFTEEPHPTLDSPIVLEWAAANPDSVVVIDSQVAFIDGDENSSKDVAAFYAKLRKLASIGPAVIVLAHTGKADTSKEYRGSSYIKGACDVGFNLTNFGGNRLGKMRLRTFKARSAAIDSDLIMRYENGNFVSDDQPTAVAKTVTEQLIELLKRNPGIKAREFEQRAADAGLGWGRARQFLKNGIACGDISVEKGPRNQQFHTWTGAE